jgi:hypothetical protein
MTDVVVRLPSSEFMRRRLLVLCLLWSALSCAGASRTTPTGDASAPVRVAPSAPETPAASDGLPDGFRTAFAAADARARAITYWTQCVATVARMRASGGFGAPGNAPRAYYCERTNEGVPVGGVFDIDSGFRAVRRLTVVRLDGSRPRYSEPLDTTRIAQSAKLVREVTRAVTPVWGRKNRPFTVVPVQIAGSAEAWVMPRASKARSFVTGGDVGYASNADGSLRILEDRTATWTQLALPPSGPFTVYSSVRDIAAVADLVTARFYTDLGRTVEVSTPVAVSALVAGLDSATGARVVWSHRTRR